MAKKETEDKLIVRAFKQDSSSVWCAMKHFIVIDGELILAAGGLHVQEEYDYVLKYFRAKKMIK